MPETRYDETYEDGKLVSRTERVVSDDEFAAEQAPEQVRQLLAKARRVMRGETNFTAAEVQRIIAAFVLERS